MINFENKEYLKLKKVDNDEVGKNVLGMLLSSERVLGCYKSGRDYIVFTDKRFIAVNVQGITGKKQDITSVPYRAITMFSVQTSAVIDIDSELDLAITAVGDVKFEFTGHSDIVEIGRMISESMFS